MTGTTTSFVSAPVHTQSPEMVRQRPPWWQRPWIASLALGLMIGLLCLLSVGGVVLCLVSLGILALVTRHDREGLFRLAVWAFSVRWLLILGITVMLVAMGHPYIAGSDTALALFGDDGYYSIRSWWLLKRILGEPLAPHDLLEVTQEFGDHNYGQSGHLYPMAFFYHLFGYSPIAVKGISAFLSVLTGWLIYDVTRNLAGTRAARMACLLVWYWPSTLLWSVTNLKDSYAIFLMCWSVWAFHRWLRRRHIGYLGLAVVALYAYATIKDFLWLLIAVAMLITWLLHIRRRTVQWLLVLCSVIPIIWFVGENPQQVDAKLKAGIRSIAMRHLNHAHQLQGTSYHILPEKFYRVVADHTGLRDFDYRYVPGMVLVGVSYFLLIPLPWHLTNAMQVAAYSQTLLWYGVLWAAAVGVRSLWHTRWQAVCLPLLVLVLLTVALAIPSGKVWTAFRHRDLVAPLYFLFAAVGLCRMWRLHEPVRV